jgi:hypothetical protein
MKAACIKTPSGQHVIKDKITCSTINNQHAAQELKAKLFLSQTEKSGENSNEDEKAKQINQKWPQSPQDR